MIRQEKRLEKKAKQAASGSGEIPNDDLGLTDDDDDDDMMPVFRTKGKKVSKIPEDADKDFYHAA